MYMKKLISIILAVMMLAGMVTISAAEEEAQAASTGSVDVSGTAEAVPVEPVPAPAPEPAAPAPALEPAPEPAAPDPAAEPAPDPEPAPEPEAPAANDVPVADEEARIVFTGSMSVSGSTDAAPGEQVELKAKVENANMTYTVTWQLYVGGEEEWAAAGEGKDLTFAAPGAGSYIYRALLKAKDGKVITREFTLTVTAPESVNEPAPAPAPAPAAEPAAPAAEEEPAPAAGESEPEEAVPAEDGEEETDAVEGTEEGTPAEDGELNTVEESEAEPAAEEAEVVPAEDAGEETEDTTEDAGDEDAEGIGDGETGEGIENGENRPEYDYERDEEGNLILDENGNPVAIVPEGGEVPVEYLRNEDGELVLDENGNPIPTQTVPTDAVVTDTLQDAENPERSIEIYYSWNNVKPALGEVVTFIAVLRGYEDVEYTVQWQQSSNNVDWTDVPDSDGLRLYEVITRDNYKDFWRVQVKITEPDA